MWNVKEIMTLQYPFQLQLLANWSSVKENDMAMSCIATSYWNFVDNKKPNFLMDE